MPSSNFLAPLPGTEEEEAPTSTTRSHVNYAPTAIFLAPLPGTEEEEEAPTSTTRSHVNYAPAAIFLAPLPGRKRISTRGVSRFQSFTLLLFCFILFLLASFYQK
jgi:hypothetical protein